MGRLILEIAPRTPPVADLLSLFGVVDAALSVVEKDGERALSYANKTVARAVLDDGIAAARSTQD